MCMFSILNPGALQGLCPAKHSFDLIVKTKTLSNACIHTHMHTLLPAVWGGDGGLCSVIEFA